MAKEKVEDHFNVHIHGVPLERLGPLTALLAREGFGDVRNELVTTIMAYKRNVQDGPKAEELLRAWIKEHPTFKAIEVVKHFEASGRTRGSAYPALSRLVEMKVLKPLGNGNYARADIKHIEGPRAKAKKKAAVASYDKYKVRNPEALLRIARRNHGRFTSELAKKHFDVLGRPISAVGPTINRLLQDKLIKRTGNGAYELIVAKPNGSGAAVEAVEVAHG